MFIRTIFMRATFIRAASIRSIITTSLLTIGLNAYAVETYSDVYVFGDSLSDVGNLRAMDFAGGPAEGQTYGSRFSNGPVIAEYVASELLNNDIEPLKPSLHLTGHILGNNFAVAGAKSLDDDGSPLTPDINLPTQINAYLQSTNGIADSTALYFLSTGGNDIRNAREIITNGIYSGTLPTDRIEAYQYIFDSAASTKNNVEQLLRSGVKNIVILGAPNIADTPENHLITENMAATVDDFLKKWQVWALPFTVKNLSTTYNELVSRHISDLKNKYPASVIHHIDIIGIVNTVSDNPRAYGFTNISDACNYTLSTFPVSQPTEECLTTTEYLYFDELHPATSANAIVANEVLTQL